MHDNHKHYHAHGHDHEAAPDDLQKLSVLLDHWIEHEESHAESYREWAGKAGEAGEDEIAREIHLAINDSDSIRAHLKRAKAILAAKLILKK